METITDILADSSRSFPDQVAFQVAAENGGLSSISYSRVASRAAALAGKLRQWGIGGSATVALLDENRPEWPIAYFAVHLAGATLIPLDAKLTAPEIQNILRHSRAAMLLASAAMLGKARQAAETLADLRVVCIDEVIDQADGDRGRAAPADLRCSSGAGDIAVISFTSGSTGAAKGVMLTHGNIVSNVHAAGNIVTCGSSDNFLSILPLNHMFEQTAGLLVPFRMGARVTYLGSINPRTIVQAMHSTGVTLCILVPAVARLFHRRILGEIKDKPAWKRRAFWIGHRISRAAERRRVPLGSLLFGSIRRHFGPQMRFFVSGGAALDKEIADFFAGVGMPILQGYGLSETAPVVSCNSLRDHRTGSVGRPVEDVEVKIVPRRGCEAGNGEILVRGPNVMAAYFEDPDTTGEVLKDGWFHTGDIGRIDRGGYLYITGRCKDVIISASGKNVYPAEIETEIARSALVKDVCVVALTPSVKKHNGEEVVALVTADDDAIGKTPPEDIAGIIREEINKACKRLADYKRPKLFGIWPGEFPKTTTLKLKKPKIVKQLDRQSLMPL